MERKKMGVHKSAQDRSTSNNTFYRILCHGKFGQENSIYDMKWGAHTFDTFTPFVFAFDF
jgi:hypothetical protein